jgi:cellulose synthase/poly-beta-1,6-N-acetylglucosamine synthase-like glycosyltransferase
MDVLEIIFWGGAALVLYTYVGYPVLMAVVARLRSPRRATEAPFAGSFSIVLAARDEASRLEARLEELTSLLERADHPGEIIVVSDGSTDATAAVALGFAGRGVRVVELTENVGKAAALSEGCTQARHNILVFADVRQRWAADALDRLLRNFADPRVGAVSGELLLESQPGVMAGVGLYWRYEKWLRQQESQVHSTVGVTGAISAVRRELFRPIPAGTLLDDVYWPLRVVMQGYRVILDRDAHAFDRLPDRPADEFRRKVRTLCGNFQLLARLPAALLPWRNPVWFALVSHKLLRLVVPWALLAMLVASALLDTIAYRRLLLLQEIGYLLGLVGLWTQTGGRARLLAAAGSFLVLNAAAWLAFWVWVSGRAGRSWQQVRYDASASSPLTPATTNHP